MGEKEKEEEGSGRVTIWLGTWVLPVCPWSRWCTQARGKCWGQWGRLSARHLAGGRRRRPARCEPAAETACRTVGRRTGTDSAALRRETTEITVVVTCDFFIYEKKKREIEQLFFFSNCFRFQGHCETNHLHTPFRFIFGLRTAKTK